MSFPQTVRVKLSSEAAESITITPVVVREIPTRELVEHMLGVTGKDVARVHEILLRGTLVNGASRFRWTGWDADLDSIHALLRTFPDPDPARPFDATQCVRAVLRGPSRRIEIPRAAGVRKPLLRRRSFWDVLMEVAVASHPHYLDYSYKERADYYSAPLSLVVLERLRKAAGLIRYTTLQDQVRVFNIESVELYALRGG